MWICQSCGAKNSGNSRFCTECGQPRPEKTRAAAATIPERGAGPLPPRRRALWPLLLAALLLVTVIVVVLIFLLDGDEPVAAPPTPLATAEPWTQPADERTGETEAPAVVLTPEPAEPEAPVEETAEAAAESGYLTDISQIDSQGLRQLCGVMDDTIAYNVRTTWGSVEHLNSSEYVGCYLLTARETNAAVRNRLILVYRNDVSVIIPAQNINKRLQYYYVLQFQNVQLQPDGTLLLGTPEGPSSTVNANVPRHTFYYNGHASLDEVYNAWVRPYADTCDLSRTGDLP